MSAVTWKSDGLGREVAYFGDIQIGAVTMTNPNSRHGNAKTTHQWAVWLPPTSVADWRDCPSERSAKTAVEKAAHAWLLKAGLCSASAVFLEAAE